MDFWQQQHRTDRRSRYYLTAFIAYLIFTIVVWYVTALGGWLVFSDWWLGPASPYEDLSAILTVSNYWQPVLLLSVTALVLCLFAAPAYAHYQTLVENSDELIRLLGGRQINPASDDVFERRALNSLEELAVAAGIPCPVLVITEDESINAFAVGTSITRATVGVTTGALRMLKRHELQGVLAHEVGHIVCGDILVNIRMLAIVRGLWTVERVGSQCIRYAEGGGILLSGGSGPLSLVVMLVGQVLHVFGQWGVQFSRVLKCAFLRQREFHADAMAVQYTRYPEGLGHALMKIAGVEHPKHPTRPSAVQDQASHFFFSSVLGSARTDWLDTHPPVRERIRALLPNYDGSILSVKQEDELTDEAGGLQPSFLAKSLEERLQEVAPIGHAPLAAETVQRIMQSFGIGPAGELLPSGRAAGPDLLEHAQKVLTCIPEPLQILCRKAQGAEALLYALALTSRSGAAAERQLRKLEELVPSPVLRSTLDIRAYLKRLGPAFRMPLLDLSEPALRTIVPTEVQRIARTCGLLREEYVEISAIDYLVDEFAQALLASKAAPVAPGTRRPQPNEFAEIIIQFCMLANTDAANAIEATKAGCLAAGVPVPPSRASHFVNVVSLGRCVATFANCAVSERLRLVRALLFAVLQDRMVLVQELELVRAISLRLGCPFPAVVPLVSANF